MSSRVSGHTLANEGAPYMFNERDVLVRMYGAYGGVAGEGRASCSCGAMSRILPSAYQRKKWHRAHKAEVVV